MTKFLGYLSLCLFALCVVAHVLTFVPSVHLSMDNSGMLHLAAMGAFGAMMVSTIFLRRRRPGGVNLDPRNWRTSKRLDHEFSDDMVPFVPRYIYRAGAALAVYVAVNFLVGLWLT